MIESPFYHTDYKNNNHHYSNHNINNHNNSNNNNNNNNNDYNINSNNGIDNNNKNLNNNPNNLLKKNNININSSLNKYSSITTTTSYSLNQANTTTLSLDSLLPPKPPILLSIFNSETIDSATKKYYFGKDSLNFISETQPYILYKSILVAKRLIGGITDYMFPPKDEILYETDPYYFYQDDTQSNDSNEFYDDPDLGSDIDEANINNNNNNHNNIYLNHQNHNIITTATTTSVINNNNNNQNMKTTTINNNNSNNSSIIVKNVNNNHLSPQNNKNKINDGANLISSPNNNINNNNNNNNNNSSNNNQISFRKKPAQNPLPFYRNSSDSSNNNINDNNNDSNNKSMTIYNNNNINQWKSQHNSNIEESFEQTQLQKQIQIQEQIIQQQKQQKQQVQLQLLQKQRQEQELSQYQQKNPQQVLKQQQQPSIPPQNNQPSNKNKQEPINSVDDFMNKFENDTNQENDENNEKRESFHRNNIIFTSFNYICSLVLNGSNINSTEKYKAKLIIGFCFTILSFIPSWIIFFWLSGINKPAVMAVIAIPMCYSSLVILKKTGSIHYPCHILCFTLCFALTINSYYTGGHQSTIRLLMSTVPIISALVLGRRASIQWSLVVLLIYLSFFVANLYGHEYIQGIPSIIIRSHMNFIIDVTIIIMTLIFTLCYQYFIDEAHRETKLKNAQLTIAKDAAIEAYQARQEFLATMSHEIRTPLNGLIGMATLLRDSHNLPPEEKTMAKAVKSCGDILLRLVNDILDLSKLEANQMGLEHIPFKIRELTQQICHVLSGQAHEKGIQLSCEVSDKIPPTLLGDSGRILQILMNLTGNALKFTQNGYVKIIVDLIEEESELVSSRKGEYNISFRVKDTGIGVPVESHQKIFEAFVQADPSDSRKYGGSGLGLYLCAKLVKLMKGEIGVYNNPDSQGSTFWFIIPLEEGAESMQSTSNTRHKVFPPDCIKVLIAEDNIINQRVAVKFLEKIGIKADVAGNGNEVLEILEKQHYDLIFMDFQMPILDGLRCSKTIREYERNDKWNRNKPSIFICGLTANTMSTDKKRCFDHGMNHFISKPFQLEQLRSAIEMALEHMKRNC